MAELSIHEPKKVVDVVPAIFDFTADLLPAETISTAVATISVHTGTDPTPSAMLYQVVTITGNVCEQKIQQGLPGVVYDVLMTIVTSTARIVEQVTRIAVLPDANPAVPIYLPLYLSSLPYPIDVTEIYHSPSITTVTGSFNYQPYIGPENIRGFSSVTSLDVFGSGVAYNNPAENIRGTTVTSSIDVFGSGITYSNPFESINGTTTVVQIDVFGSGVTYSIPYENIRGTTTVASITVS